MKNTIYFHIEIKKGESISNYIENLIKVRESIEKMGGCLIANTSQTIVFWDTNEREELKNEQ